MTCIYMYVFLFVLLSVYDRGFIYNHMMCLYVCVHINKGLTMHVITPHTYTDDVAITYNNRI